MTTRTTRTAAALVAAAALVVGLNGLSSPTQAAPSMKNSPTVALDVQAGGTVYRTRPFGNTLVDNVPKYFTVKIPRSGNYEVTMRGIASIGSTTSVQCLLGDKTKLLANDLTGLYAVEFVDGASSFGIVGMNEAIDVDLRKSRALLFACGAFGGDAAVAKPITATFERNGDFKNISAKPFTPPAPREADLFGNLD